jgi:hypothetical protein
MFLGLRLQLIIVKASALLPLSFVPTLVFATDVVTMTQTPAATQAFSDRGRPHGCNRLGPVDQQSGDSTDRGSCDEVVGVSGTHMTLNGSPWLSRGVVLHGFVRPLSALESESASNQAAAQLLNARLNYGLTELAAIRAFHADTIRFQISQPALDPNSPLYDANYFNDVVSAITTARKAGFVVMVMMQDQMITGDSGEAPLPTSETQSDWDLFTSAFGSDRGVVFELYNEPNLLA